MGRDGHDRARTVAHQDVVGDVDGDLFPVGRVYGVGAGEDTRLFPRHVGAVDLAHPGGPLDVGAHLFGLLRGRYLLDRRVLGLITKNVAPKSVSGRVVKTSTGP